MTEEVVREATSFDDLLGELHLPETSVQICTRGDLQARWEDLSRQLEVARRSPDADTLAGMSGQARRIAQQMEDLRNQMQAHTRLIRLRALPQSEWSDLLARPEHKARKEDDPADYNRKTFPVSALAACAVAPPMTVEQAGKLVDRLSQGQWDKLWMAVLQLNKGEADIPFSAVASAILSVTPTS
ncbi:MAG TPA: hypothetical protein VIR33_10720 [Thermopolyspora sp.]|jgi:hypothetical protein